MKAKEKEKEKEMLTDFRKLEYFYREHRTMVHVIEFDHQNSIKNKMIPFTIAV